MATTPSSAFPVGSDLSADSSHSKEVLRFLPPTVIAIIAFSFWFIIGDTIIASIGYINGKAEQGLFHGAVMGAGHVAGLFALAVIGWSQRLRNILIGLAKPFEQHSNVLWLILAITLVRVLWIVLVPTAPYSDGEVYEGLGRGLVERGEYGTETSRAHWPPGYPWLIAATYSIFGFSLFMVKFASIALAALTEWCVWVWLKRYTNVSIAAAGVLMLVCWPSRTMHLDILSYDDLVLGTMMLSLVLMPSIHDTKISVWKWGLSGLALGLCFMTRPTALLVIIALGGWMCISRCPWNRTLRVAGIYTVAMLIPWIPWVVRNYYVFDAFVPLPTEGGTNLYHSYSPGGDGAYYGPAGDEILAAAGGKTDEITVNQVGFELTKKIIRERPLFALKRVLVDKPILYLGSDNALAFLEDGYMKNWPDSPNFAKGFKAVGLFICNTYYIVLMLCPLLFIRQVKDCVTRYPAVGFIFMIFFSGFVAHSLFQAQARYHLIYTPFWTMCLAMMFFYCPRRRTAN